MRTYITSEAKRKGQSLIEILVALGIGVVLIGGVTALISVNLRNSAESKTTQAASALVQEVVDGVRSIGEANWSAVYGLAKGPTNKYYIASSTLAITPGTESASVGGYVFTRYFYVENVNRTQCGTGLPTTTAETGGCHDGFPASDIAQDPSTQKITVVVGWTGGKDISQSQYIVRGKNAVILQTDWSGGGGDNSVMTTPGSTYAAAVNIDGSTLPGAIKVVLSGASGGGPTTPNIDATDHWAWNDVIGWIDFGYGPGNVGVNNAKLFGYASSSVGLIAFDCATSPNGNICGGPAGNWRVSNVGTALQGWAYNDVIGWISFDSVTAGSSYSYGVTIDPSGEFKGYAWNDAIGWISMNCLNGNPPYACGSPQNASYRVKTSWVSSADSGSLTSPIFDLGNLVALNSVIWKGVANGGAVRFQIAASALATGPWNDADYKGPDGTSATTYITGGPDVSTALSPRDFSSVRYIRYKVFIDSNAGRTDGPEVRDIIVSYSL